MKKLSSFNKSVPYSCCFNEQEYWDRVANHKKEVLRESNQCYLVLKHKHHDFYIHATKSENVDSILSSGYLIADDNKFNALGKAVYTFPLMSGRFDCSSEDLSYIVFESNEEHFHIVETDDSDHELGESDFLVDKLKIINPSVFNFDEITRISRKYFNSKGVLRNYFGIDSNVRVEYDDLCKIVNELR